MKTITFEKTLPNEFEDPSVFCASQEGFDFGTCKGDSGGPIRVFDDSDWKFRQIGVVHGSAASCDGSRFPGIFVRLDDPEVLNFIQSEVFGTSSCKVRAKFYDSYYFNDKFIPYRFTNLLTCKIMTIFCHLL